MKRYRRLRRLVPDEELVRRRTAGESLRALGGAYGVAHTTLGRYFARPELVRQLRKARQGVRAERRDAAARRARERRSRVEVRRQAREQAREHARRAAARRSAAPRRRRSPYGAWLDEHDARLPLARADLRSGSDELAEGAVGSGGGIEAVVEATGLRSVENVLRLIDPAILVRAFENEALAAAMADPERDRLRRLLPDLELVRRRAAGESLRQLAAEYDVAHTTLGRWFARPQVARQLRDLRRRGAAGGADDRASRADARGAQQLRKAAEEHAATIRATRCPVHGRAAEARIVEDAGEHRIEASFCCERAKERALRALRKPDAN